MHIIVAVRLAIVAASFAWAVVAMLVAVLKGGSHGAVAHVIVAAMVYFFANPNKADTERFYAWFTLYLKAEQAKAAGVVRP